MARNKLASHKDARKMLKALERQGWRIERGKSHTLAYDPWGKYRPLIFGKASDHRTRANNLSEIKKRDPNFDLSLLT